MNAQSIVKHLAAGLLLSLALLFGGCSKENKLSSHLQKAASAYEKRNFEVAKIEYFNSIRIQPTNGIANLRLGKIFYEQGQLAPAFAFLIKGRQAFPDDVEARSQIAVILAGLPGETNRMAFRTEIEEVLRRSPTNETAVLLLGSMVRNPEELASTESRLNALRSAHGNLAVYDLAEAAIASARGDRAAAERSLQRAVATSPEMPTAHHLYANFLAQDGRRDQVEIHLKKAHDLSAPNSPVRLAWARFLYGVGRIDESRAVLDKLNADAPERTAAWVARAELAIQEKKLDDAERVLARAAGQAPMDLDVIRAYAQLRLAQNRPELAIRDLERAEKIRPDLDGVQIQLARAHLANKDVPRAMGALERALQLRPTAAPAAVLLSQLHVSRGALDQATIVLRESIRSNPGFEPSYLQLARVQSASGRLEDAFNALQVARSRFTNSAEVPLQQGLILRRMNRNDDARKAFEQSAKLGSTNELAAFEQLVLLDVASTNYAAAHRRLNDRISQSPNQHLLWLVRCEVFLHEGNLEDAERAARRAIELNPEAMDAYMSLSRVLARNSARRADALKELETLLSKRPDDLSALILSAEIQQQQKEYGKAAKLYEQALKARPGNAYLHNNLAFLQAEHLKLLDEAQRTAERARELAPEDPAIADTLAWIHFRRGQYPEALRLLQEASSKLGSAHEIQYHLGMTHYMMGHEIEAKQALAYAVQSPRPFPGIDEAKSHLASLVDSTPTGGGDAVMALEKRVAESPKDVIAMLRLATAYSAAGNDEGAKKTYENVLRINPKSTSALSRLARLTAKLGDKARAAELLRTAKSIAPNDAEVAGTSGQLALASGDLPGAATGLADALRQFPDRADIGFDLARTQILLGRNGEARATLARFGKSPLPTGDAPAVMIATLDAIESAAPGSASAVDAVLKENPNDPCGLIAYGALATARGQLDIAEKAYRRVLQQYPDSPAALRGVAVTRSEGPASADDASAYDAAVKARSTLANDDRLGTALGVLAVRKGEHRFALPLLTAAATGPMSKSGRVQYYLGLAHQGVGQKAEARKAFQSALQLDAKAPFSEDAAARLASLKED